MSQARGIIFDMDGVLVNTEPLHFQATQEILASYGVPLTEADYFSRYIVYSDWEVMEMLLPPDLSRPAACAAKSARYLELVRTGIPAFPDGLDLLRRAVGWRVALATGSMRQEAELALATHGILDRFETIVTREDCTEGKPSPEPFLRAAKAVGVMPVRCVVIEDTPGGVQAAKAGGMHCVAVTHSCPAWRLAAADLVVDDLRQVDLEAVLPWSS